MTRRMEEHEEAPNPSLKLDSSDPRHHTRTIPFQVLNLSFCRTGTVTLQVALNTLGLPCFHPIIWFRDSRSCAQWDQALDAKFSSRGRPYTRADWDRLLGSYAAASDTPTIAFAEDLVAAYPEAKVILVERDLERWYASFDATVIQSTWSPLLQWLRRRGAWPVVPMGDTHLRWIEGWMGCRGKEEMRAKARAFYRAHYEHVRAVTPRERLLEYRLEDGWGPLCEFLGKPVPDCPFPRTNDAQALREMIGVLAWRAVWSYSVRFAKLVVPVVVVALAVWAVRARTVRV